MWRQIYRHNKTSKIAKKQMNRGTLPWKTNITFTVNSYQRYQDYNLIRQDARFVYIRLISDAQIKIVVKPNKYKVEEHWGPQNTQKACSCSSCESHNRAFNTGQKATITFKTAPCAVSSEIRFKRIRIDFVRCNNTKSGRDKTEHDGKYLIFKIKQFLRIF